MRVHLAETFEAGDVHLRVRVVAAQLAGDRVALFVGVRHALLLAAAQLEERRHGGIDIAVFDERPHIPEEEREQKRPDVRAVHIGIGHDDDLVIAELIDVELIANARAERNDQRIELVVAVDLIDARLLNV